MKNKKFKVLFFGSIIFLLFSVFSFFQIEKYNDGKLHVVFCDVGQGDAVFIRTPKGEDILIDSGPNESVLQCLSNNMPFWDKDLELVVLSHHHSDHETGLLSVLVRYNVLSFYTEKDSLNPSKTDKEIDKLLAQKNVKKAFLQKGDKFKIEDLILKTFSSADSALQNDPNNSLIELLTYKNFKILFPGDSPSQFEDKVAGEIGKVDVLKVAHHGSKTGTDQYLLSILKPELAVISVGKNNKYNLPSKDVERILGAKDIRILRTDREGEIRVISDGEKFWIE
ncbi:MAG: MBL fold metallo-hydrolase [Patescibacteria group bacterium]|nr:MBL fold metallo-hydrolase [Patescibacteria group bacterium]